ncbi:hypothetical protein EMIHUDRAFT_223368 [Emiliania huxleyi CCMP1516]|uniref:Uncharacterized protein n=2 Tax=Emiliania huxleyi TaxID=2903 RepID=A0A0D3KVN5_EMIH1|nr:hypothetical protein EMIHUDRAFT_223368 [Emiliania huxleyi CCMP1516]EOD39820.1 hypothetical protein EMIHUDRAFT_223368 [Emiliania huxleyi CCMP1516]|eukprot:XP_005792249.1 hypothetical protein EMIHUDRAFT_223368 [Emiliania huxleyi CCMP1516]
MRRSSLGGRAITRHETVLIAYRAQRDGERVPLSAMLEQVEANRRQIEALDATRRREQAAAATPGSAAAAPSCAVSSSLGAPAYDPQRLRESRLVVLRIWAESLAQWIDHRFGSSQMACVSAYR